MLVAMQIEKQMDTRYNVEVESIKSMKIHETMEVASTKMEKLRRQET